MWADVDNSVDCVRISPQNCAFTAISKKENRFCLWKTLWEMWSTLSFCVHFFKISICTNDADLNILEAAIRKDLP